MILSEVKYRSVFLTISATDFLCDFHRVLSAFIPHLYDGNYGAQDYRAYGFCKD